MNVTIDEFNDGCGATLNVSSASSDRGGNDNADKMCNTISSNCGRDNGENMLMNRI